jgi:peptidoglycan/LPS O-acetylase OafA/YrhL
MYLFHWPPMALALPHLDRVRSSLPLAVAIVIFGAIAVYGLARVSYRFFEAPFLRLKDRLHA